MEEGHDTGILQIDKILALPSYRLNSVKVTDVLLAWWENTVLQGIIVISFPLLDYEMITLSVFEADINNYNIFVIRISSITMPYIIWEMFDRFVSMHKKLQKIF